MLGGWLAGGAVSGSRRRRCVPEAGQPRVAGRYPAAVRSEDPFRIAGIQASRSDESGC